MDQIDEVIAKARALSELGAKRAMFGPGFREQEHRQNMDGVRAQLSGEMASQAAALRAELAEAMGAHQAQMGRQMAGMAEVQALSQSPQPQPPAPQSSVDIMRDDQGRIAGFSDGRRVIRDADGRPTRIG